MDGHVRVIYSIVHETQLNFLKYTFWRERYCGVEEVTVGGCGEH